MNVLNNFLVFELEVMHVLLSASACLVEDVPALGFVFGSAIIIAPVLDLVNVFELCFI